MAELLIAIALLGIIALMVMPKVLLSANTVDTTARVKDTISALEQVWYVAKLNNEYVAGTKLYENVATRLNVLSYGNTAPPSGGCIAYTGYIYFDTGIIVAGLSGASPADAIPDDLTQAGVENTLLCIDTHASSPNHTVGQNVFFGVFNPTGDFDVNSGAVYTPSAESKNFLWGTAAAGSLYKPDGSPAVAGDDYFPAGAAAGTYLGT